MVAKKLISNPANSLHFLFIYAHLLFYIFLTDF